MHWLGSVREELNSLSVGTERRLGDRVWDVVWGSNYRIENFRKALTPP
jgi:hypothetical protein